MYYNGHEMGTYSVDKSDVIAWLRALDRAKAKLYLDPALVGSGSVTTAIAQINTAAGGLRSLLETPEQE